MTPGHQVHTALRRSHQSRQRVILLGGYKALGSLVTFNSKSKGCSTAIGKIRKGRILKVMMLLLGTERHPRDSIKVVRNRGNVMMETGGGLVRIQHQVIILADGAND